MPQVLEHKPIIGAQSQEIPRNGTFEGRWEVVGKAMQIDLGPSRSVSVAKFEGAVVLEGSARGLARGFRADCVSLQDQSTGPRPISAMPAS